MLRTLLVIALVTGCCEQAEGCPEQSVVLLITPGVEGVIVSGDLALECSTGESETVCTPGGAVPVGDYALVVEIPGQPPMDVALPVRTNTAPPFSCECQVREGSATIELDVPEEDEATDAG
jgi:hypothetical protein